MNNSALGDRWEDVRAELFTPEEIAESNLRVALMAAMVEARHEKGISQRQLEALSGVRQPLLARIEKGYTSPRLDTISKVLSALGKKLAIVPIDTTA